MPHPAVETELKAGIEDALARAGFTATSWLIVAAVINEDGSETLLRETSDHLPVWSRTGMLCEALYDEGWDEEEEADG